MFDLSLWIEIPKSLGIKDFYYKRLSKKSLDMFANVEHKIEKIRNSLSIEKEMSSPEIEENLRYLNSLASMLVKNWQEIVTGSLQIIVKKFEKMLSQERYNLKLIRKFLDCFKIIYNERTYSSSFKIQCLDPRIDEALCKIKDLEERAIRKYINDK